MPQVAFWLQTAQRRAVLSRQSWHSTDSLKSAPGGFVDETPGPQETGSLRAPKTRAPSRKSSIAAATPGIAALEDWLLPATAGELDASFGSAGVAEVGFAPPFQMTATDQSAYGLAIDPSGNVVAAGYVDSEPGRPDSPGTVAGISAAVARLTPAGSADSNFGRFGTGRDQYLVRPSECGGAGRRFQRHRPEQSRKHPVHEWEYQRDVSGRITRMTVISRRAHRTSFG